MCAFSFFRSFYCPFFINEKNKNKQTNKIDDKIEKRKRAKEMTTIYH